MEPRIRKSEYKEKIGTVLSKEIIEKIKSKSIKEKRSMSEIIEEALKKYVNDSNDDYTIRWEAFQRFTSNKNRLSKEDIDELLNEDYFDQ